MTAQIIRMGALQTLVTQVLRILALLSTLGLNMALAHEVLPAIGDLTVVDGKLTLSIRTSVEGFIAGINLTKVKDTNESPLAQSYDSLRALTPDEIEARFKTFWPEMASRLRLLADGKQLVTRLEAIEVSEQSDIALARPAILTIAAEVPAQAKQITFGWSEEFGALVLRQQGVDKPYTGMLEAGSESEPIQIGGGGEVGAWQTFVDYIPVGFDHIIPNGLDHILFVLGLFFFSTKLKPLLWQITAFTLAHTLTLAMSSLGVISLPASIVEPLIAVSIVFVAIENIFNKSNSTYCRPIVVFGFGLLHGLGFAAVLSEFGLPEGTFIPALIGFNIGVELGQLAIVSIAALLLWTWTANKPWYRGAIAIPASVTIAAIGSYWVVERTLF